ncbi:MAG: glycosyltransferase [Xanthomonadales bacterium]|nr:glycosyltransferase [Xanthomonadales bacterium]
MTHQNEARLDLSVVTVHLDDFAGLRRTRESLPALGDVAFEWIVIDGGSSPENAEETDELQRTRTRAQVFVSEPDNGIYDAMNKGTARCRGSYVLYLNAGDWLHPGLPAGELSRELRAGRSPMLWGQGYDRDARGELYPRRTRSPKWLRVGMPVSHQAVLFRRNALGERPYDTRLGYAGDYDLLCRLARLEPGPGIVAWPISVFDLQGASSDNMHAASAEEARVRARYYRMPGVINQSLRWAKMLNWKLSQRLPALRRRWRTRV